MGSKELRKKFLEFFEKRGHKIIPSASLIPENDSTTLFTGSGMQPLVPYLMGEPHPQGKRLVDVQKSFRAEDIEEVGDNRHTTFFEMMGNWSLGDYFKKEQLNWLFEFLVKEIQLDPQRIYVSVFRGNKEIGIEKDLESVKKMECRMVVFFIMMKLKIGGRVQGFLLRCRLEKLVDQIVKFSMI